MASNLGYGLNAMLPMLMQGVQERNQARQMQLQQKLQTDMKMADNFFDILGNKNAAESVKKWAYQGLSKLYQPYSKQPFPAYEDFVGTDRAPEIIKQMRDSTKRFVEGSVPMNTYATTMMQLRDDLKNAGGAELDVKELIGGGKQERGMSLLKNLSLINQAMGSGQYAGADKDFLLSRAGEMKGELPLLMGAPEAKAAMEGIEPRTEQPMSTLGKLMADRKRLIDSGISADDEQVKSFDAMIQKTITPTGMRVKVNPDGSITFEQGAIGGLEKSTKGQIEKDILAADKQVMALEDMYKMFKPEYLTYAGKTKAELQSFANKLGLKTPVEFLSQQKQWYSRSKQTQLEFRKWVTGVAGNEKEFGEIAKSFADADNDAPAVYIAKTIESIRWGKKIGNWLRVTKAQGLSISETPEDLGQSGGPQTAEEYMKSRGF